MRRLVIEKFYEQCTKTTDQIASPMYYTKDKSGKIRQWQAFVQVINQSGDAVSINSDWINHAPMDIGLRGKYYCKYGVLNGKLITTEGYLVTSGTNLGKINATNVFTQTLQNVMSEVNHKIKEGYKTTQEATENNEGRPYIMSFTDRTSDLSKIQYPGYAQRKYDGVMVVLDVHNQECYSRSRDTYQTHYLKPDLKTIQEQFIDKKIYFVGEYYTHGVPLQELSGNIRNQKDVFPRKIYIFDCFDAQNPGLTVPERMEIIDKIKNLSLNYIEFTESVLCKDEKEMMVQYEKFISEGYEGLMFRPANSTYGFSYNGEHRSTQCAKVKPRFDGEWPVVGFETGNGKETNAVIWACEHKGTIFTAVPMMPTEWRVKIGTYLLSNREVFDSRIRSHLLTIEYSIISKDGIPQQPKAKSFKDPDVSAFLVSLK